MELLEDYDFEFQYHLGKANVVVDALSQKSHAELASLMCRELQMMGDLSEFEFEVEENENGAFLFNLSAQPALVKRVIDAQLGDNEVRFLLDDVLSEVGIEGWEVGSD